MSIKAGDIIFAYEKGFQHVVSITDGMLEAPGHTVSSLVTCFKIFNEDGTKAPGRKSVCAIDFCKRVTKRDLDRLINTHQETIKRLRFIRDLVPKA